MDDTVSMEIDAILFFQLETDRTLAVHIEMKMDDERLSRGQAEAYRPRAECFQSGGRRRRTLLSHSDFLTVLFCGTEPENVANFFDRIILHTDARRIIPGYPVNIP